MPLTEKNFIEAARELNCDVAAIKAVAEVETRGEPFLPDGRPVILFEAHVFGRLTQYRFNGSHPHISTKDWNKKLYKGGVKEWTRLEEASGLNVDAALMSASWGRFQIMGFNFPLCGFAAVGAFVAAMTNSEQQQLDAFVAFVKSKDLDDELQRCDWPGFARGYNGKGFRANQYDDKLKEAYEEFRCQK